MAVSSKHPQYLKFCDKWEIVKSVIDSNIQDKLVPIDKNDKERTERYKANAILLNFTARTKEGFSGRIFDKDPQYKIPLKLQYLLDDATPEGFKLKDFAQNCLDEVLELGRVGVLVDYPSREERTTIKDVQMNNIHARFSKYDAASIINWAQERINGRLVLSLVTLKECNSVLNDDLSWSEQKQYRVLRLINGTYVQQVFDDEEKLISEHIPLKGDGSTWTEIPFVFMGAKNNDANVDKPPMYDLAVLNIGHYKNSANLEETGHIIGQPMLVVCSDMSQEQFTQALGGKDLIVGSRRGLFLGVNGSATYTQLADSQFNNILMVGKEDQAAKVGAQLIMTKAGNETAEAARMREGAETSVLQKMAKNVGFGTERLIYYASIFENVQVAEDGSDIEYYLNQEFFKYIADPVAVTAAIQLFDRGIVSSKDLFDMAKKAGIVDEEKTIEETQSEINNESPIVGMYRPQNQDQTAQQLGYSDRQAAMG
jgi:hypothetical protein